jgi:uncharacterized short protein YbdD (DUF466 family)
MRPLELEGLSAARNGAADASGDARSAAAETSGDVSATKGAVSGRARGIGQICRQLFGIPDYERYLAHAAARHPGAPVLSRRDFCAQAIERKYGKSGPRCC